MKGISAVIAVVLILMITVALAAMAYVWFTGVFETITTGAGESATKTGEIIATSYSIASAAENVDGDLLIYVTNTGTSDIEISNMNIFISGQKVNVTTDVSGILSPGDTVEFTGGEDYTSSCNNQTSVTYGSLKQMSTILCE